ncbi:Exopolysaccharide synthesis ExoD [Gloeothece citriformis PCC 7424]|uniref:Exopolysaccharide synthesis ExoD n=1 Tax=Gloeothece citriformis (strain PCC 7424) TaxID=65393 RepID=B7KEI5_GLOC7|nr:exopolysaccharide biosynthesis protein [Gloeothece citriformis]ACK73303.1 Exopolysaccharide synthesis ExoD [Gloeothece citriformis PCC 7424]
MHLKFSQDLDSLLKRLADHPLTLKEILDETSERGFSLMIGVLALPFLFPMPPGLPLIFTSASILLSLQMAWGKRKPWLPKKIARIQFPKSLSRQLLSKLKGFLRIVEKITRPRWLGIANHSYTWQLNGCLMTWLGLLLMLPIPFTNPLPTIGILALSIATLESDGLLMCLGYLWSIGITVLFVFIAYALWQAPTLLFN